METSLEPSEEPGEGLVPRGRQVEHSRRKPTRAKAWGQERKEPGGRAACAPGPGARGAGASSSLPLQRRLRSLFLTPLWGPGMPMSPRQAWGPPTRTSEASVERDTAQTVQVPNSCKRPHPRVIEGLRVLRSRGTRVERSEVPFREATPAAAWTVCCRRETGLGGPVSECHGQGAPLPPGPAPNTCCLCSATTRRDSLALAFPKLATHPQRRELLPRLGRLRRSKRQGGWWERSRDPPSSGECVKGARPVQEVSYPGAGASTPLPDLGGTWGTWDSWAGVS